MYTPTQRLMRSRHDKIIAGVAGGIAQYLAVDPTIVRLAFVALCFTGVGVLLYPLLWLVMPLESSGQAAGNHAHEVFVAPGSTPRQPRFDPMTGAPIDPEAEIPITNVNSGSRLADAQARRNRLLGIILLSVGAFILITMIPGVGHLIGRFLFPILLIGAGIILLRRYSS